MLFSHHSTLSSTAAPSTSSCGIHVLELAWDGRLEEARRSLLSVSGVGMGVDAGVQLAVLEAFVAAGRLEEAGEVLVELRRWGFEPETGVVQALIGTRGPSFRHFMADSACVRVAGGADFPRHLLRRVASGAECHIPWRTLAVAVDLVARALGDDGHLVGPAPPGKVTPPLDRYRSALLSPATSPSSTAAPFQMIQERKAAWSIIYSTADDEHEEGRGDDIPGYGFEIRAARHRETQPVLNKLLFCTAKNCRNCV